MFSLYGEEFSVARGRLDGLTVFKVLLASLLPDGDDVALAAAAVSATSLFASAMARDTLGGASGFHPSLPPNTPQGVASGLILWPLGLNDFLPEPVSSRNMGRDLLRGVLEGSTRLLAAVVEGDVFVEVEVALSGDNVLRELGDFFVFGLVGVDETSQTLDALTMGVKPVCPLAV